MGQAYDKLCEQFARIYKLQHLGAICGWDQAAKMPAGGSEARAEALSELAVLIHQQFQAPALADGFAAASEETLDAEQQAALHSMRRRWQQQTLLPQALVAAKSLAGSRCEHAWRRQRAENDWAGFAASWAEVVRLGREEAVLRGEATDTSPYDALLDLYEPGMQSAELDRVFAELDGWLPEMLQQAQVLQQQELVLEPCGPFAQPAQEALGREVMALLGFDFAHGRLDVSTHPFCGGVPEDVRITTRYGRDEFTQSLLGIIHETGHARYEQNLPSAWRYLPLGEARSMGVHESQSLLFEMQLGRSRPFLKLLAPRLRAAFGDDPAFAIDNLSRLYTRVQPGLIRVDADELSYPGHVMLRYAIERDLIEGRLEIDQVPERWDQLMQHYFGLSTAGNYRDGCMQDIHWTDGTFGYFPSYTLGALYAAQLFAAVRRDVPNLEHAIESGDLEPLFSWLRSRIWQQGSRWPTVELIEQATGEPLNTAHFRRHLEQRYLKR